MREVTHHDQHKVRISAVRVWRRQSGEDTTRPICAYCHEYDPLNPRCNATCGTGNLWVDTATLAKMTLEGINHAKDY
jgi:hypothetical protein